MASSDHRKCWNCKTILHTPIIFCGDCWRIGTTGVLIGGILFGVVVKLLKMKGWL